MKSLIVYYSLEGNTKFVADTINEVLKGDIIKLQPKKDISKSGFKKYLWGGKQVLFKNKPELVDFQLDLSNYDFVILCTPVWAGKFVPAFNTFFYKYKMKGKKVGLLCTYGGSEGKTFDEFKKQLNDSEIIGEISFKEPLKNDKIQVASDVKKWINKFV